MRYSDASGAGNPSGTSMSKFRFYAYPNKKGKRKDNYKGKWFKGPMSLRKKDLDKDLDATFKKEKQA